MPGFSAQEGKFKSDNYISMQILTTNNERFQITTAKSTPSNNGTTYALENSEPFSSVTVTQRLRSYKSKCINENKDDNKLFDPGTSTKYLRGCGNKHIGKNSKKNDS